MATPSANSEMDNEEVAQAEEGMSQDDAINKTQQNQSDILQIAFETSVNNNAITENNNNNNDSSDNDCYETSNNPSSQQLTNTGSTSFSDAFVPPPSGPSVPPPSYLSFQPSHSRLHCDSGKRPTQTEGVRKPQLL